MEKIHLMFHRFGPYMKITTIPTPDGLYDLFNETTASFHTISLHTF